MTPDNIDDLYSKLKQAGYDDIGTPTEFRQYVSNKDGVNTLYKALSNAGYNDIGTQQEFTDYLTPKQQAKQVQQPEEQTSEKPAGKAAQQVVDEYDNSAKNEAENLVDPFDKKSDYSNMMQSGEGVEKPIQTDFTDSWNLVKPVYAKQNEINDWGQQKVNEVGKMKNDINPMMLNNKPLKAPYFNQNAQNKHDELVLNDQIMANFDENLKNLSLKSAEAMKNEFSREGLNPDDFTKSMNAAQVGNQVADPIQAVKSSMALADKLTKNMDKEQKKQFMLNMLSSMENKLIEKNVPKNSLDYIFMQGIKDSDTGKMFSAAINTDYERYLDNIAAQRYKPNFMEQVAKGGVSLAIDLWEFMGPGKVGAEAGKQVTKRVAADLIKRGLTKTQSERVAEQIVKNSFKKGLVRNGISNATTFAGAEATSGAIGNVTGTSSADQQILEAQAKGQHLTQAQQDAIRQKENNKRYNPVNVAKAALKGGAEGAVMGAATALGGPIANAIGKGKGVAGKILSKGAGLLTDAGAMTGVSTAEQAVQGEKITAGDVAKNFVANTLTFAGMKAANGLNISKNIKAFKAEGAREKDYDINSTDKENLKNLGYGNFMDSLERLATGTNKPQPKGKGVIRSVIEGGKEGFQKIKSSKNTLPENGGITQIDAQNITKGMHQLISDYDAGMVSEETVRKYYGMLTGDYSKELQPITGIGTQEVTSPQGQKQYFVNYLDAKGRIVKQRQVKSALDASSAENDYYNQVNLNAISHLENGLTYKNVEQSINNASLDVQDRINRLNDLYAKQQYHEKDKMQPDLTPDEKKELKSGLTEDEMDIATYQQYKPFLESGMQKQSYLRDDISSEERTAINAAQRVYDKFMVKDNSADEFAKNYEQEVGLREGDLSQAMQGHTKKEAERIAKEMEANTGEKEEIYPIGNDRYRTSTENIIINDYRIHLENVFNGDKESTTEQEQPTDKETEQPQTKQPVTDTKEEETTTEGAPINEEPPTDKIAPTDAAQPTSESVQPTESNATTQPTTTEGKTEAAQVSESYSKARNALSSNNVEDLQQVGHDIDLSDMRMTHLFPEDKRTEIYNLIENGGDIEKYIKDNNLSEQQVDAIKQLSDATEMQKGLDDVLQEKREQRDDEATATAWRIADEKGNITPIELKNGTTVFLKSGDVTNKDGAIIASYLDENGQPKEIQLSTQDIDTIAEPVSAEDYAYEKAREMMGEDKLNFILTRDNMTVGVGEEVNLSAGGVDMPFTVSAITPDGKNAILTDKQGQSMQVSLSEIQQNKYKIREQQLKDELDKELKGSNTTKTIQATKPTNEAPTETQPSTQEPDYEKMNPEDTYNAIKQEVGDDASTAAIVSTQIEDAKNALSKAKKAKIKGNTVTEKIASQKQNNEAIQKLQGTLDYWNSVNDHISKLHEEEQKKKTAIAIEEEKKRKAEELKAKEQEEIGDNNVSQAIRKKWNNSQKIDGYPNEIVLPNGEKISGHYVVAESGAATPSHNATKEFAKTEGFPIDANNQSVNDRDYERDKDAQNVTRTIASNYDSRAMQTPVVVSKDGIVLSGNGRTMAGELAATNNTDNAYIEHLRKYPQQYGFTTEQIDGFKHPRLLFVPDKNMPYTADTFAKFNQQEMKGQSKTEQAVKLGKIVDDATYGRTIKLINKYDTLGDFYADNKATASVISDLQRAGAITQAQIPEMYDGDTLSAQGKEILENTLIGKAFENNPDAVRQITKYKSVRQSIITALSEISNNKMLGSDYSLEKEIADAIKLVYDARNAGIKAGDKASTFARQGNLFQLDEGLTVADYKNATVMMLSDILNDGRTTLLKKMLTLFNKNAKDGAAGQVDMFSGDIRKKEDIIKDILNFINHGTEKEQQTAINTAVQQRKEESLQQDGTSDAGDNRSGQGNEVKEETSTTKKEVEAKSSEKEKEIAPPKKEEKASGTKDAFSSLVDESKKRIEETKKEVANKEPKKKQELKNATDILKEIDRRNGESKPQKDDKKENAEKPLKSDKKDVTSQGTEQNLFGETEPKQPKTKEQDLFGDSKDIRKDDENETKFVNKLISYIDISDKKNRLNINALRKIAKECGIGEKSDTDLQELCELALVTKARSLVSDKSKSDEEKYNSIVALYESQPTISMRDSERIEKQQYSTPLPFAYAMDMFLTKDKKITSALEPSAGNGALVVGLPRYIVHVNDIDDARIANLRKQGFKEVTTQNGLLPFKDIVDAVVTNPPFGSITTKEYGNYKIGSLEAQMSINALNSMKDDGRAAIIIGGNTEYKPNGALDNKDKAFLGYLYDNYNVADIINLDGKLYARQGTSFPTRIILIEGRRVDKSSGRIFAPVKDKARAEQIKSFEELYKRINDDIQQIKKSRPLSTDNNPIKGEDGKRTDATTDVKVANTERDRGSRGLNDTKLPSSNGAELEPGRNGGEPSGKSNQSQVVSSGNPLRNGTGAVSKATTERGINSNEQRGSQSGDGGQSNDVKLVHNERPKPDIRARLGEEKTPYPKRSLSGEIGSVVPTAQVKSLDDVLSKFDDIDQYLVDRLGYGDKNELYGKLAAEQIDGVALAINQLEKNGAFIIGDMTGVGKGRQAAAIIRYGVKQGKNPIFITVKPELFSDMYRDLSDIGSDDLKPFTLISDSGETRKAAKITDANGKLIYDVPSKAETQRVCDYILKNGKLPPEYNFLITKYDLFGNGTIVYDKKTGKEKQKEFKGEVSASAKNGQQRRNIISALARDNYLVMDESHNAGGEGNGSMFWRSVLPSTKGVTFLSATFAKRPDNMPIYSIKTDMGNSGIKPEELINAIARGGATLQEIMSKDLTASGQLIRRERDFSGVTIDWHVNEDEKDIAKQKEQFNKIIDIFNDILDFQNDYINPRIEEANSEAAVEQGFVEKTKGTKDLGLSNTPFASKTYNLIQQLLFSLNAKEAANRAIVHLKNGHKPVIAVNNTMEGFIDDLPSDTDIQKPDFSSTLIKSLQSVLKYTNTDADGNKTDLIYNIADLGEAALSKYREIENKINQMSSGLSISPIDEIKKVITDNGYRVGELTGRKTELKINDDGTVRKINRVDRDKKKLARDFNNGDLDVVIMNRSASTGISLHASTKFKDQKQRAMIFAQMQADINEEIQMRGRIDRTGQVYRAIYEYIVSQIPAQQRLMAMFKAKLKSLDANTTASQKSKFNEMEVTDYLNKYGDEVVLEYLIEHRDLYEKLADPLGWDKNLESGSIEDASVEWLLRNMKQGVRENLAHTVSGRFALLNVAEQERVLRDITDAYNVKMNLLNETGENDLEIKELPLHAKTLKKEVWKKGNDNSGKNAFASNTYIEQVEMNVLKKPMKAEEVRSQQKTMLGDRPYEDYIEDTKKKINEYNQNALKEADEKNKIDATKKAEVAANKYKASAIQLRKKGKNKFTDEEIDKLSEIQRKNTYDNVRGRMDAMKRNMEDKMKRIDEIMQSYSPDKTVCIPSDFSNLDQLELSPNFGRLIGYKFNRSYSLSSSTAVFATLDGRRKVEIPLSKSSFFTAINKNTQAYIREARVVNLDNWDKLAPKETKKKGIIITGNILQALVDTENKGQLVSYTDDNDNVKQGILMPDKFDPSKLTVTKPISSALEEIKTMHESGKVSSSDGLVDIYKLPRYMSDDFLIEVPLSKKRGGVYYLDDTLRKLVGGNFTSSGNKMMAKFSEDNLPKILKRLDNLGVTIKEERKTDIKFSRDSAVRANEDASDARIEKWLYDIRLGYADKSEYITPSNVHIFLYETSGEFMRGTSPFRSSTVENGKINIAEAKKYYENIKPKLTEYKNILDKAKNYSTGSATMLLDQRISDIDDALQYYKDLSEGKNVWRDRLPDEIRYRTSTQLDTEYPTWLSGQINQNGKHSTQVAGTIGTYNKLGTFIKENRPSAKILDASSGMGLGTIAMKKLGLNVEDVEPYPSDDRVKPTYKKYEDINKKYDWIISNAVLNVIPDDWRADVLKNMADKLEIGGKLFINTRNVNEVKTIKDKVELDSPNEVLVKRNDKIASYQRFYTVSELKDWVANQLGDGFSVEAANENNSGTKGLTAIVVTRNNNSPLKYRFIGEKNISVPTNAYGEKPLYTPDREIKEVKGIATDAASDIADRLGGVGVKIEDENTITDSSLKREIEMSDNVKGWFDPKDNSVHLYLPNITSKEDAARTIFHEKLGHEGLKALFGNDEAVNDFGNFIFKSATPDIRQRILERADREGYSFTDKDRYSKAAQEVFSDIASEGPKTENEFSLWRKIKHYIIKVLNRLGLRVRGILNDNDLAYYVAKTAEALKRKGNNKSEGIEIHPHITTMFDRDGKPRRKQGESDVHYFQRLREYEKFKNAIEESKEANDPMPERDSIMGEAEKNFTDDLKKYKEENNIPDEELKYPKRKEGETPQDFAKRVAEYEETQDLMKDAPNYFDYMKRANEEWRSKWSDWKARYGIQETESVDEILYSGKTSEPATEEEAQRNADTDASAMRDLSEALGIDISPEGAKRHVKISIIDRRKNMESAGCEDALFIHDITKRTNKIAKEMSTKENPITGKMIREALPFLIERTYGTELTKDADGNIVSIPVEVPIRHTEALDNLINDINTWYANTFKYIEDAGLRGDAGYIPERYVTHIWDKEKSDPAAYSKYVENFQRTKDPYMKHRTINTYQEGIMLGLKPKYTDISDILAKYSNTAIESVCNKRLIDDLKNYRIISTNAAGEEISLPLVTDTDAFIDTNEYNEYKVPGLRKLYVNKNAGSRLVNVFGQLRTQGVPNAVTKAGKIYDTTASIAKKTQLGFSGFHAGALTEVAIAQMGPVRAAKALVKYIMFDCVKARTMPAYAHPEDFKFAAKHLVQLGATQDYAAKDVNIVTEKIRNWTRKIADKNILAEPFSLAATALDLMNKGMDKMLWNYLHDGLKIACMNMFKEQVDKRVAKMGLSEDMREKMYDEAGQLVNDTFGGQFWELINVSPATVKWMQRALLSPDWLTSTQRHFFSNFGFGSLYDDGGFKNYLKYNGQNVERLLGLDIEHNELRRIRSNNAKKCYILGAVLFFGSMMYALNAMFRNKDEELEKQEADEIRKTNPDYKSPYELAYPNGMHWYDYTMYGNTKGQQTHLFLGRYKDGTEWYVRWGKQFREFPELFIGKNGFEIGEPFMERLWAKVGPMPHLAISLAQVYGMYDFRTPEDVKRMVDKYGKTLTALYTVIHHFVPIFIPNQADKEFKLLDLMFPSQKGFTRSKTISYFEDCIERGDMKSLAKVYQGAVLNKIDAEKCLQAAISVLKAKARDNMADGMISLPTAMSKFDKATTLAEKKLAREKINKFLSDGEYKNFTLAEAKEKAQKFINGNDITEKDNDKYIMLSNSSDMRDDYKINSLYHRSKMYYDQIKEAAINGNEQTVKQLENTYKSWLNIYMITRSERSATNKIKRALGRGEDKKLMEAIRNIRKTSISEINSIQAPK